MTGVSQDAGSHRAPSLMVVSVALVLHLQAHLQSIVLAIKWSRKRLDVVGAQNLGTLTDLSYVNISHCASLHSKTFFSSVCLPCLPFSRHPPSGETLQELVAGDPPIPNYS